MIFHNICGPCTVFIYYKKSAPAVHPSYTPAIFSAHFMVIDCNVQAASKEHIDILYNNINEAIHISVNV